MASEASHWITVGKSSSLASFFSCKEVFQVLSVCDVFVNFGSYGVERSMYIYIYVYIYIHIYIYIYKHIYLQPPWHAKDNNPQNLYKALAETTPERAKEHSNGY